MDIRVAFETARTDTCAFRPSPPPTYSYFPLHQNRHVTDLPWKKKHRRKRGKRAGVAVRLRSSADLLSTGPGMIRGLCLHWRSLDSSYRWLRPVFPGLVSLCCLLPHVRRGGVNTSNLRLIRRSTQPQGEVSPFHVALINARFLVNKTFILNYFYTLHALDALCITETWIKPGDLSPFTELVPQGCSFLNSPRLSGRGGGLATVLKDSYLCRSLSTGTHSCFEVLLFQLSLVNPVVFAVIYRPPNVNKEFLNEFAQFMSEIVTSYDRILILGDFNIHVCCDSKPLSKDFLRLLDSFDFVQWVSGPTHAQEHTLDLILSRGVSVLDIKIEDAGISDHLPILFSVSLDGNTPSQS